MGEEYSVKKGNKNPPPENGIERGILSILLVV